MGRNRYHSHRLYSKVRNGLKFANLDDIQPTTTWSIGERERYLKALHSIYRRKCHDRFLPQIEHFLQIDTSHRWIPPAEGQLPWSETPPVHGHLEMDISLEWTPPVDGHLPGVDTSHRQTLDQFMIPATYNVQVCKHIVFTLPLSPLLSREQQIVVPKVSSYRKYMTVHVY